MTSGSTHDGPSGDPHGPADDAGAPRDRTGLSTDYLNHYSEILMLIEMASFDEDAVADLSGWRPVGYRRYFERSPLRRAASALAAYDALPPQRRAGFEQNVEALDKARGRRDPRAAAALPSAQHGGRLIDGCAAFLNSDGAAPCGSADEPQAIIDRLIA